MAYINGTENFSANTTLQGDSAFIRYSANADGTDFTEEWSEGQNYIGFATGQTAPTDKSGYTWVFVGNDIPLEKGISENTVQQNGNVTTGGKAFKFSKIDATNKKFTLVHADGSNVSVDDVGYEVGDEYSFMFVHKYNTSNGDSETYSANVKTDFIGKIVSVQTESDGSTTVTVDTLHYTVKGDAVIADEYTENCLFIVPTKPDVGDVLIGEHSVTFGVNNTNVGYAGLVSGEGHTNSGCYVLMGGKFNKGGYCGLVGGRENFVPANYGTAGGANHNVTGIRGAAFNTHNNVEGYAGFAANQHNDVFHENGAVFGYYNKTTAKNQFVGGKFANPSTNALFTIGNGASDTARANAFEVIEINGVAYLRLNNTNICAKGNSFYIYGCSAEDYGVSFGANSKSSVGALSFGEQGKATGYCSFSGGRKTIASQQFQTALGMFNAENADALMMIGNGTAENNRSNAFEVLKSGGIKIGNTTLTEEQLQKLLALLS